MVLNAEPLWLSAVVVVVVPTIFAMAGPMIIRRWVWLDALSLNNEVAGFKFATLGVLYAVLLAFAVILVWQHFSEAESNVVGEADAAATIYRLIDGLEAESGPTLNRNLTTYLETAVGEEWPAMERGRGVLRSRRLSTGPMLRPWLTSRLIGVE